MPAEITTIGTVFVDHRHVGYLPNPGAMGYSHFRADDPRYKSLNGIQVWRNPNPIRHVFGESDLIAALEWLNN